MGFPLFNVKELDAPPMGGSNAAPKPSAANAIESSGASRPTESAQPTTYLRDLVVILIILAALAGIVALAYYFPRWL